MVQSDDRDLAAVNGEAATPPRDPTMRKPAGKPTDENVPPAGGDSMVPPDSPHPHAPPGGKDGVEE